MNWRRRACVADVHTDVHTDVRCGPKWEFSVIGRKSFTDSSVSDEEPTMRHPPRGGSMMEGRRGPPPRKRSRPPRMWLYLDIAHMISEVKMRSHLRTVGPKSSDWCPYKMRRRHRDTCAEEVVT